MERELKEKKIGVLMGGCSSEREISLKSGGAVIKALQEAGCDVRPLDITSQDHAAIFHQIKEANLDIAFIALHGRLGEDGRIQQILESLFLPYTGSGVEASQRALNKGVTYTCLKDQGVSVPPYALFQRSQKEYRLPPELKGKVVVVKPVSEGSSIGISIVPEPSKLEEAMTQAFRYDEEILIEEYIPGKELTVGILENKLLPVIEIRPKRKFFDYTAKYEAGLTEYLVPAPIEASLAQNAQEVARKVHEMIGCRHLSRVDMMVDRDNKIYVLEINTIPGLTATSLLPKAARAVGMDFTELCFYLIKLTYGT